MPSLMKKPPTSKPYGPSFKTPFVRIQRRFSFHWGRCMFCLRVGTKDNWPHWITTVYKYESAVACQECMREMGLLW